MASRTRGMAKGDEDLTDLDQIVTLLQLIKDTDGIKKITDAVDVSDRWNRQLGMIDLERYRGLACGPLNPIDVSAIIAGGVVDITDRWPRQLGQIDLARVLGAALSVANPVIAGIFDAAGNRMPSMDNALRPGYIDIIDRAARLLGIVYGNLGQLQQRAASLDLYVQLRSAGVEIDPRTIRALTAADIVTVQGITNALPVGTNSLGSLTQSTKHDAKVYQFTADGSAVDGATVISNVANKVIKIHRMFLQATVDGATDVYLYEETSGNLVTTKTTLYAREGRESAFVFAPACLGQTTTQNKKVLLKNAAAKQVNWEITFSADDAS